MKLISKIGIVATSVLLGAACGGQDNGITSMDDFANAYEEVGGVCQEWLKAPQPRGRSIEDFKCDETSRFTLYNSRRSLLGSLIGVHATQLVAADFDGEEPRDADLVVGPSWILQDVDPRIRKEFASRYNGEPIRLLDKDAIARLRTELTDLDSTGSMEVLVSSCLITALGDGGSSITIDTKGSGEASGEQLEDAFCVLRTLGAPDFLIELVQSTRALDGRQSEEWDGYRADWRYHPDSGLQLTIIRTS